MKATFTSAVLSAAALANAASIPHGHAHAHTARAAALQKRAPAQFLSAADSSRLSNVLGMGFGSDALTPQQVTPGKNLAAGSQDNLPVAVGGDGPFLVEFHNDADEDIILVAWSNVGQVNPWDTAFVNKPDSPPDATHTLKAGTNTTMSFDPKHAANNSISGGFAGLYSDTILNNGQIYNTWGEYTFQTNDDSSTADVSRLINLNGNKMSVSTYASKDDKDSACDSDMDKCAYVCEDGSVSCEFGGIMRDCPYGQKGNTASQDGRNGGCAGMSSEGGFVKVTFH